MKIIINEQQYNLLLESIDGIDKFVDDIFEHKILVGRNLTNEQLIDFSNRLKKSIRESGCQSIKFEGLGVSFGGLSLHNGVLIGQYFITQPMSILLYVIFHEIAHQYQFKKYGIDIMYKPFRTDRDFEDAINILKEREYVADEYARRKIREFTKLGYISPSIDFNNFGYKTITIEQFKEGYRKIFDEIDNANDNDRISEIIYNTTLKGKL